MSNTQVNPVKCTINYTIGLYVLLLQTKTADILYNKFSVNTPRDNTSYKVNCPDLAATKLQD